MPNRYIREGINDSKTINQLSWFGEVFYRRLMLKVDDFGRQEADAEILRCELFKRQLAKVSEADIERVLAECEKTNPPALFTYQHGDKRFLVMNKWEQGRAAKSRHPEPTEKVRKCLHMFASVNTTEHKSPTPTYAPSPSPSPKPTTTPKLKSDKGSEKVLAKLNQRQKDCADRMESALGKQWVNDSGKWVNRIKADLGKAERVIAEVESAVNENRIKTTPAQYAEQIWKEFE